jgi:CopG family nickel-responsive transcriptional regulator
MTERFTISLDAKLAKEFDALIRARGYQNRSEAVRDILRQHLESHRLRSDQAPFCIGALSYVYNHHQRELSERLTSYQHDHHDLVVSTMHAHLDHENCIESVIVRGRTPAVQQFAEALMAQPGVRHGVLNLVPADVEAGGHDHRHVHSHPKS